MVVISHGVFSDEYRNLQKLILNRTVITLKIER